VGKTEYDDWNISINLMTSKCNATNKPLSYYHECQFGLRDFILAFYQAFL